MQTSFLAETKKAPDALSLLRLKSWRRHAVAVALGSIRGVSPAQIASDLWGEEAAIVTRAASSPATLTGWGSPLAATIAGAWLQNLRPRSAAAILFDAAFRVNLDGYSTVTLPRKASPFTAPAFVAEGAPIPVIQGATAAATIGPPKKLASIAVLAGELVEASDAEAMINDAMDEAAGLALDGAVFSSTGADSTRPAGLLAGVTPITASGLTADGDDIQGMRADLAALVGAIAAAGGGSHVMFFAAPVQALKIGFSAGANFAYPVVPVAALAAHTIIAIDVGAIASGFSGLPDVTVSRDATLHYEDSAPAQIGTAGSLNVVAAPARDAFQSDLFMLKMILRCAWVNRLPGAVQIITGTAW